MSNWPEPPAKRAFEKEVPAETAPSAAKPAETFAGEGE
jgi:hypothetical protein